MNKKTVVLGASLNPTKYSYLAITRLVDNNHSVRALGRKEGEVNGVKIYTSQKVFRDIDTITIYLSMKNQVGFYSYIIALNPKRVLFNPGTENVEFEKITF